METTWNVTKAAMNLRKHGIRFEDAITIFDDPLIVDMEDPWHSMMNSGCSPPEPRTESATA